MPNKLTAAARVLFFIAIILLAGSCKKEKQPGTPTVPKTQMEYFNLNSTEIKANAQGFSIDVNHDGRNDLRFNTQLVGDPINQVDKLQFLITSNIEVNLPVNSSEQIPVMDKGESIVLEDFNGYHWFQLSSIMLVQKVISFSAPVWEGHWKNAIHKYLPYQVVENGKRYNGWVELSADIPGEKIVLHNAAISKEMDKIVKAGE